MKCASIAIALVSAAFAVQAPSAGAQDESEKQGAMQTDPRLGQQMLEHMKEMQSLMDKIRQTTDPNERQKLMAEHMKRMQEGMEMMRAMGGGMMGMMHGGASAGMTGPRGGQSPEMLERRMDMMQMMMEQMMQHQQMMQSPPAK